MRGYDLTDSWMHTHRWTLFFLCLAFIFAIPLLLIVSSPVLHAVGLHDLASAGDNMNAATDGQEAAMGSTAASAAAGAAAAGSGSGSENGRGKDDDALAPLTPSSGSEDDLAPLTPSSDSDTGTGSSPGDDSGSTLKGDDTSPVEPLNPETSKPMHCDEDGCTGGAADSPGSRSSGSDSSSSGSNSDSSSSGSGDGSSYKDWFGLPDWFPGK
jgi:hypothetical protein